MPNKSNLLLLLLITSFHKMHSLYFKELHSVVRIDLTHTIKLLLVLLRTKSYPANRFCSKSLWSHSFEIWSPFYSNEGNIKNIMNIWGYVVNLFRNITLIISLVLRWGSLHIQIPWSTLCLSIEKRIRMEHPLGQRGHQLWP